jgi:hypothetical protein
MPRRTTRIDLHSHTRGSDGVGSPEEIAKHAKKAHLHALCLTDHHTNNTDEVLRVADALIAVGVMPIVGCEYSTKEGHLLIFGTYVPKYRWGEYPAMQDVVDEVNREGGCCITPHPYKGYTRSLQDKVMTIRGLAAVEVLNGQVEQRNPETNLKARNAAVKMGVHMVGASDAHVPWDLGTTYTETSSTVPLTRPSLLPVCRTMA